MNALAGGGSFVTLPALMAAGVPSVQANASSTVALYPGGLASAWTYRQRLGTIGGAPIRPLLAVTLAGGSAGSLLLLWTPASAFTLLLPWLLLWATLALAFGRRIGARIRRADHDAPPKRWRLLLIQFVLGLYGGYFGGAVGLMMLAVWTLLGETDIKALNGPRTLLVSAANTVAALIFSVAGAVWWPQTLAMLAGGLLGGHLGARLGRIAPAKLTRRLTLCAAGAITLAFFIKTYVF